MSLAKKPETCSGAQYIMLIHVAGPTNHVWYLNLHLQKNDFASWISMNIHEYPLIIQGWIIHELSINIH